MLKCDMTTFGPNCNMHNKLITYAAGMSRSDTESPHQGILCLWVFIALHRWTGLNHDEGVNTLSTSFTQRRDARRPASAGPCGNSWRPPFDGGAGAGVLRSKWLYNLAFCAADEAADASLSAGQLRKEAWQRQLSGSIKKQ